MSVEIFSNGDGAVFICNTTDWAFGPKMPGENVAEAFLATFQRPDDPRHYSDSDLASKWAEFNAKLMVCPNGHRKADPTTYGNETIFCCWEKGCKVEWNLAGEEIKDDADEVDHESDMALAESRQQ